MDSAPHFKTERTDSFDRKRKLHAGDDADHGVSKRVQLFSDAPARMTVGINEQTALHLRVLCNVPVESDFFMENACHALRLCTPEKNFESALVGEMLEHMGKYGADEARLAASKPFLRVALKNHLTDIFTGLLAWRTKDVANFKDMILNVWDAAAARHSGDVFTHSLREEMSKLFVQQESPVVHADQVTVGTKTGEVTAAYANQATVGTQTEELAAVHADQITAGTQTEVATAAPNGESRDTSSLLMTDPLQAVMPMDLDKAPQLNGEAKTTSSPVMLSTAAAELPQESSTETQPTESTPHTEQIDNNSTQSAAIVEDSVHQKAAEVMSGVQETSNLPDGATQAERSPLQNRVSSRDVTGENIESFDTNHLVPKGPRIQSTKDLTCWHWYNRRPPCRLTHAQCPYSHEEKDYMRNRRFGPPIPLLAKRKNVSSTLNSLNGLESVSNGANGPQGPTESITSDRKTWPNILESPSSIKSQAGNHEFSLSQSVKTEPGISNGGPDIEMGHCILGSGQQLEDTELSLTPIVDTFWGIYVPIRPTDRENMQEAISKNIVGRDKFKNLVTICKDSKGIIRDYDPVSAQGLKTKINGLFSLPVDNFDQTKMRMKLELLLRPLVQANRSIFHDLPPHAFGNAHHRDLSDRSSVVDTGSSNVASESEDRREPHDEEERCPWWKEKVTCVFWYEGSCFKTAETCMFEHSMTDWLSTKRGRRPVPMPSEASRAGMTDSYRPRHDDFAR